MGERSPGHRPKNLPSRSSRKGQDPTKTGRALRQTQKTGTVADLKARLGVTDAEVPFNGPGAQGPNVVHDLFVRDDTMFPARRVHAVFDAVRQAPAVQEAATHIEAMKAKPGRHAKISPTTLVVGMILTATDNQGCLASEIAKTLYRRIYPAEQALLGITPLPPAATNAERRLQRWRTEKQVRSALHRLLATVDPSIHPKNRSLSWVLLDERKEPLTDDQIEERRAALSLLCNQILQLPFDLMPASIKQKYRGSACVDGTPIETFSRGESVDSTIAATDPDAGFYDRRDDHSEQRDTRRRRQAKFGFEINLMVAVDDHEGERQFMPALPLAMHMDRPGADPAGATRRMMAFLDTRNMQPRFLAGDGVYARANPEAFHIPARQIGWKMVLPVLDADVGVQAIIDGALLIEGALYCPSIPQILITATLDLRSGAINLDTYLDRIEQRKMYLMRDNGLNRSGTQRWTCPAGGNHSTAMCARKPASEAKPFISGPNLTVRRLKDRIYPSDTDPGQPLPLPCRQDTFTTKVPDAAPSNEAERAVARFTQDLLFGTIEHTRIYNTLRQSQEGFHGFIKDDAKEAIGKPGKRRIRGLAAQSLFVAVLLAAAAIRKIRGFVENAILDDNGDYYVKRQLRVGEHATTNLPPGTPGTRGHPDFDEQAA